MVLFILCLLFGQQLCGQFGERITSSSEWAPLLVGQTGLIVSTHGVGEKTVN